MVLYKQTAVIPEVKPISPILKNAFKYGSVKWHECILFSSSMFALPSSSPPFEVTFFMLLLQHNAIR